MRILIITGVFPPRRYGGVTTISYLVSKKLKERGHEVTVFTTDVGNNPHSRLKVRSTDMLDGVQVHYFKNINNLLAFKHRILSPLGMIPALIRNTRSYDIIHLNGLRNIHDIVGAYFAKKYRVPYVQQSHGDIPRVMSKKGLKWLNDALFSYRLIKNAARVIALNEWEAGHYKAIGVPKEKIAIIPNGIDLSTFLNLPPRGFFKKRFHVPENRKIILYLGRIDEIKGVDLLVRAYANLVRNMRYENTILVIAGPDEVFLNKIKSLAISLDILNSILFTGPLYGEDKLRAYVDSDIYVLPSKYETFPMSLLEAYACAKPVICSKVGGLKDLVINGVTGFLVEPTNTKELAEKMLYLLDNNDKAKEMGVKARRLVEEKFSIDKVVSRLEILYEEVLKEWRRSE